MLTFHRLLPALAVLAGLLSASPAHAQGCGPQNPNCIVPTAPPGTNTNQAASTAFVAQAISPFSAPGGSNGQQQYNNNGVFGGFTQSGDILVNTLTGVATIQPNAVTTPKILDANVTNAKLAVGAADTIKGSGNGAATLDLAVPNCAGALIYSTATHTFSCNAAAGTVTLFTIAGASGIAVSGTCTITTTGTCTIDMPIGSVIQSVEAAPYGANAALTTIVPADDTIPTNTEGDQILALTITPRLSTSRIRCRFRGSLTASAPDNVTSSIFAGSTNIGASIINVPTAANKFTTAIEASYLPGSVSAQSITVRTGPATATSIYYNGTSGGRLLGGASAATLVCEEIKV